MGPFRCLILDLDGTVTDSHAFTFAAFRHACSPYRSAPGDEEIYERFGPEEQVILCQLVGPVHAAAAHERLQTYYATHVREVRAHPEVRLLLEACRKRGVARGLFTGRGRTATRLLLRALRMQGDFDAVVAGEDAPPKPAGEGVRLLLRQLDRGPEESVVVGDSPLDLQAAAAAGVPAMLATWYAQGARHAASASHSLTSPSQLLPFLGSL